MWAFGVYFSHHFWVSCHIKLCITIYMNKSHLKYMKVKKKKRERERRCVKGEIKKTYRFSWFSHHRPIPYLSTVSYKHPYLLHRPFRDPCSQVTAMKEAEKVLNISKQEMRWETEIQNEKSKSKYGKSYQHISLYKPGSNFIECFVDFL